MVRRLFLSFLLCCLTAIVCFYAMPRLGLPMPWFVPFLAFFAIAGATILAEVQRASGAEGPDAGAEEFAEGEDHAGDDAAP